MLHARATDSKQRSSSTQRTAAPRPDAPLHYVPPVVGAVYGNQAMLRAAFGTIQRKCSCGGECASCKAEKEKEPHGIQAKLRVNTPGDAFEQEADRMADQVVGGAGSSAGLLSRPAIQRKVGGESPQAAAAERDVLPRSLGPGRPLDSATQSFMEARFGSDFSGVRIHSGTWAAANAESVNALAYTMGHDIVFGAGQYSPGSTEGNRLLAHELTHVLQQNPQTAGLAVRRPPPRWIQRQSASPGVADEDAAEIPSEVPSEDKFGRFGPDPGCPKPPTRLGDVRPDPPCPEDDPVDIATVCEEMDPIQRSRECDTYNFCFDSDIFLFPETPGKVMRFARNQPAAAIFTVHAYASEEGIKQHHDYNVRLSCHRAKRVAKELLKAGVPPEHIRIAAKGPTTSFGPAEFSRVAMVRAVGPVTSPMPKYGKPKTPEDRRKMLHAAIERINLGGYRLEADAYISFWTCGRVPTLRHAVNITTFYIEGEPGAGKVEHSKTLPVIVGDVEESDLNAATMAQVVFDRDKGDLSCVMAAATHLAFIDKVSAEDFGSNRGKKSDRERAGSYLRWLAGFSCVDEETAPSDPRADKPAPKCLKTSGPTFKGAAATGEAGATVPEFEVDELSVQGLPGTGRLLPLAGNQASLETTSKPTDTTPIPAFQSHARVTLHGNPKGFSNYDIGFVLTATRDTAQMNYSKGEIIRRSVPTPIRETDDLEPTEPWYSEESYDQPKQGRVAVSMSKAMALLLPLRFQELSGKSAALGGDLTSVSRQAEYELWLIARRHGAPLDRFSTHFLQGNHLAFNQNWDAAQQPPAGQFQTDLPGGGFATNPDLVRFTGPTPEELETKETSTTNVPKPSCSEALAVAKGDFDVRNNVPSGVSNAAEADITTDKKPSMAILRGTRHLNYEPIISYNKPPVGKPKFPLDRFEVGLIQNLLKFEERFHYATVSGKQIIPTTCFAQLPIRDGASSIKEPAFFDPVFFSNEPGILAHFQNGVASLEQQDQPATGTPMELADLCPKKNLKGTLEKIILQQNFRTWLDVRFNQDDGCAAALSHHDWHTDWEAKFPDKKVKRGDMVVDVKEGDGSPKFETGDVVANDVCIHAECD